MEGEDVIVVIQLTDASADIPSSGCAGDVTFCNVEGSVEV